MKQRFHVLLKKKIGFVSNVFLSSLFPSPNCRFTRFLITKFPTLALKVRRFFGTRKTTRFSELFLAKKNTHRFFLSFLAYKILVHILQVLLYHVWVSQHFAKFVKLVHLLTKFLKKCSRGIVKKSRFFRYRNPTKFSSN